VRWALARVEARRLVRHPLFLLGMTISIVALALASSRLPFGALDGTDIPAMLAGDCFVVLGAALWTFVVAYLATSRERRDDAHDFYAGQAVTPALRTQATLLSLGAAALAGGALIAAAALLLGVEAGTTYDGHALTDVDGRPLAVTPLELLQGPLLLVVAGTLGVLLGTWTGHVYVAVLTAFAAFLPPGGLLAYFVFADDQPSGFYGAVQLGAPLGWQVARLGGLALVLAAGALARHDRRPRIALLALVGLALAVAGYMFGWPEHVAPGP
jgi:hypothetical protein